MTTRGHEPILIDEFNGLWVRGDPESAPMDHFTDCENVKLPVSTGVETRDAVDIYPVGLVANQTMPNAVRIYTYVRQNVQSLLVLDTLGNIYDTGSPTPFTPILTIAGMTDFAFVNFAGRAYICPHNGVTGLPNEFLYVYLGNGTPARKAAGNGPELNNGFAAAVGPAGHVETGYHIFAVVYETDTGFLTKLGPVEPDDNDPDTVEDVYFAFVLVNGTNKVTLTNVPVSPSSYVVARHIVATKAISPIVWDNNLKGYQFYFVPEGKIANNVATTIDVDFYDADLLEDASHLLDLFTEIPAFVNLNLYHNRLVGVGEYGAPNVSPQLDKSGLESVARLSYPGEPEAIDQVSGLIQTPLEGNPLTNCQEFRDILYLFKKTRTYSYADNGDDPSSWPLVIIDQGIGASVHGVATVLDSGGVNIEYLVLIDYSGVMVFNGAYQRPELSWKVADLWKALDRSAFKVIQVLNDSLSQIIYITLPDKKMLNGYYSNGLEPTKIRWVKWRFDFEVDTIALINTNTLIIGSAAPAVVP